MSEESFACKTPNPLDDVREKALFLIGSVTKSMTTLLEATLVDGGKLG